MTPDEVQRRITEHRWTAHNLELAPGVWTLPGKPSLIAGDKRLAAVLKLCRVIRGNDLTGVRVLDLGCLEGGISVGLALEGATVVGVEARAEHVAKCNVARDALGLTELTFVQDDVNDLTKDRFGTFDVVVALGIFYHLDDPVGWLRRLASMVDGVVFIDSHYAPIDEAGLEAVRPGLRRRLGPLTELELDGLPVTGRWYDEWSTIAERDEAPWASWLNKRSFWLTKLSFAQAIRHAGFDSVVEQYDYWMDRYDVFTGEYPRTMFVGLRARR